MLVHRRLYNVARGVIRPTSGYSFWLSAADLNQASGSAVTSWFDRVSNTEFGQANATRQPTFQPLGLNNRPCVRFDGTDDFVISSSVANVAPTNKTIVMACLANTAVASARIMVNQVSGNWYAGITNGGGGGGKNRMVVSYNNATPAQQVVSSAADSAPVNIAYVMSARWSVSGSDVTVVERINGVDVTVGGSFATGITAGPTGAIIVGALGVAANPWPGDLGEIIVYNTALTDQELADTENYLYAAYLIDRS